MPCGDITEQIRIKLDRESRLKSYSFSKKTCCGAIGLETLIIDLVIDKTAEDIVRISEIELFSTTKFTDKNNEYLALKHLFALKTTLEVFLGVAPGGVSEECTIASVEYENNETIIDADISNKLITDKIESCGDCGLKE
jgi:NifU-like protein involved in Fe-S cluster formation